MNILTLWLIVIGMFVAMWVVMKREIWLSWLGYASKVNCLLWKHPNNGGGLILTKVDDPPGKDWYIEWLRKYVKFCYEDETKPGKYTIKPYVPKMVGDITPTALFDCRDWRPAGRLFMPPPSFLEKLNAWVRIGMFGILFFAIMMIAGELGKGS